MLDSLIGQFAGGGAQNLEGAALHEGVGQLLGSAPTEHSTGAISDALQALGAGGFGQSVAQGSANATPEQRSGLAGMFLNAVEQGGGSRDGILSSLGLGSGAASSQDLGALAEGVAGNHPGALASVLGSALAGGGGSGGSSGMLSLLGSPMVRQIGMNLAQRLM